VASGFEVGKDAFECGITALISCYGGNTLGVPILECVNEGPFGPHTTRHTIDTERNTPHPISDPVS
jgi:hypothetical protein